MKVKTTNFSSTVDLQLLLDSLYRTFSEFKSHEQIENRLIMRKLRSKMRQNEAVCNCHKVSSGIVLFLFITFLSLCSRGICHGRVSCLLYTSDAADE